MPNYPANPALQTPYALYRGDSVLAFNAEQPAVLPQASARFAMPPAPDGGPAPGIFAEVIFSGAPGAFNLQIQGTDTDADANYITPSDPAGTITVVTANNVARTGLIPISGKFIRGLLSSRTNAVNVTLKFSRP